MTKRLANLSKLGRVTVTVHDPTSWQIELFLWRQTRTWAEGKNLNEALQRMEARVKQMLWTSVKKEADE